MLKSTSDAQTAVDAKGESLSNDAAKTPVQETWKTLQTQVAGHQFTHGTYDHKKLGMIDLGNGTILKSLQSPPRGPREAGFYEKVFDPKCSDHDLLELRPFLSPFHGIVEKGKDKFLKLGNLVSGFQHPCVLDLKMGRVTYDQEATPEKIEHEVAKYPPLENLGFQFTGMMVYDPETGSEEHYQKPYCRDLTEKNICREGLGRFFGLHNGTLRRDAIQPVICKLRKLESWFLKQKKFSFIASSLLIIYEGSKVAGKLSKPSENVTASNKCSEAEKNYNGSSQANQETRKCEPVNSSDLRTNANTLNSRLQKRHSEDDQTDVNERMKKARLSTNSSLTSEIVDKSQRKESESSLVANVHLIDFAHAFPATDIDHNFLFGLQKLLSCLESLLNSE